jgi:hypothetical protein
MADPNIMDTWAVFNNWGYAPLKKHGKGKEKAP